MKSLLLTLTMLAATFAGAQVMRLDSVPGKSLVLNGTGGAHLGNPSFISNISTGGFTISAWIKTSVSGKRQQIVALGNYHDKDEAVWFFINDRGRLQADLSYNAGPSGITMVADGSWHHVALVVGSAGSFYLYVDGHREIGPVTMTPNLQGRDSSFAIGRSMLSSTEEVFGFEGEIDEVKIFMNARHDADLRFDMYRPSHNTESLYAYYQFNRTVQDSVIDGFGRFSGVLTGGAAVKHSTAPIGNKNVGMQLNARAEDIWYYNNNDTTLRFSLTDTFDRQIEVYTNEMAFAPNITPYNTTAYPKMWLMRAYGGDPGTFAGNLKLKLPTARLDKENMRLYWREANSDGNWTLISTADPSDVKTSSVTFRGVNKFGQFLVASKAVQNALDEQEHIQVKVYPNPATDNVYIQHGQADGITAVNVYSITGQLVFSGKPGMSETTLNISELEKGYYIVRMQGATQVYTGRFIKE
jgi:hypothetical protein